MKGQIEKRSPGVYRLRWYLGRVDGKRKYASKTIRGTKKQAEKALREILGRQDRGLAVPTRLPTVEEFFETWKLGEAAAKLRPRTLRDYGQVFKAHVVPKLGSVSLNAVHTARIEAEIVQPLREAEKHRTAQLAVVVLSKLYRSALKDPALGLVGNPCAGVEVGRGTVRNVQPLSASERQQFCEAIRGTADEPLFLLLMGTGLRPGEAIALGWEHVDLSAGLVRVERSVDNRRQFHAPKTDKGRRTVPLPPEVRASLRELHMAEGRPSEGLVFHRAGEVLNLTTLLRERFRPALKRAGLAEERVAEIRLYDLRHGYATAALEAGADVRTTSELMGHASTRMVLEVYSHVSDQRKREASARIGKSLFGSK